MISFFFCNNGFPPSNRYILYSTAIASCTGKRVVVEETPEIEENESVLSEISEIMDIAYILDNTVRKKWYMDILDYSDVFYKAERLYKK